MVHLDGGREERTGQKDLGTRAGESKVRPTKGRLVTAITNLPTDSGYRGRVRRHLERRMMPLYFIAVIPSL